MSTNYDLYYKQYPHGLGEPFDEFVKFFNENNKASMSVLDLGAGQGRDSLFIARLGHNVTAVDISPIGLKQLKIDADLENLNIATVVADINQYNTDVMFDIIIIDRTLHMLSEDKWLMVLNRIVKNVKPDGYVLIADEKLNIIRMKLFFKDIGWLVTFDKNGFLFVINNV